MAGIRDFVVLTLSDPDFLQAGDGGALLAIRLFPSTPLTRKHVVVPYREMTEDDGFVITAYLTSSPSRTREVVWTRSASGRVRLP
jgi:hypothetical protein